MTYFNFKVEIRFIICAVLLVPFELHADSVPISYQLCKKHSVKLDQQIRV